MRCSRYADAQDPVGFIGEVKLYSCGSSRVLRGYIQFAQLSPALNISQLKLLERVYRNYRVQCPVGSPVENFESAFFYFPFSPSIYRTFVYHLERGSRSHSR